MGNLNLFRAAKSVMDENADGGVFIYTASTAVSQIHRVSMSLLTCLKGKSVSGSSMAYSVTKAAGKSLLWQQYVLC
jgi:hypothetical protein